MIKVKGFGHALLVELDGKKLSAEDVLGIRELLEEGKLLQREIVSLFGITRSTVCDIKNKKRWGKLKEVV